MGLDGGVAHDSQGLEGALGCSNAIAYPTRLRGEHALLGGAFKQVFLLLLACHYWGQLLQVDVQRTQMVLIKLT